LNNRFHAVQRILRFGRRDCAYVGFSFATSEPIIAPSPE
jgi:hypothetical protein